MATTDGERVYFRVPAQTKSHANISRDKRVCCVVESSGASYYDNKAAMVHGVAQDLSAGASDSIESALTGIPTRSTAHPRLDPSSRSDWTTSSALPSRRSDTATTTGRICDLGIASSNALEDVIALSHRRDLPRLRHEAAADIGPLLVFGSVAAISMDPCAEIPTTRSAASA